MTIDQLLSSDRRYLWHPYDSATSPAPVNVARQASGVTIRLADGTALIDGISSWWCACHGHNRPEIIEAIQEQSGKLSHVMFAGFTHESAVRLGELIAEALPEGLNRVFFADSGSVAVECAAKMAVQYQYAAGKRTRNRLCALRGGYHGDTAGAMALCDPEGMHTLFGGLVATHFFAPQPEIPFDGNWVDSAFEPFERIIRGNEKQIAGVICEPLFQGGNAMRFYHPEYLRKLRALCDEYDILLIADEIATGFGRTGEYFGCSHAGIVPDIACIGKGLTGGAITLGAAVASDKVAETISSVPPGKFMHGPTFMANPLACAAGCASLELFKRYDWRGNVKAIEAQMRSGLARLKELPNVKEIRVLGAVGVAELHRLPPPGAVQRAVLETGVWLRPFGNWLYAMPPFVTTPEELSHIMEAMYRVASL